MADGQDGEAGDDTEMLIPCHYSTSKGKSYFVMLVTKLCI